MWWMRPFPLRAHALVLVLLSLVCAPWTARGRSFRHESVRKQSLLRPQHAPPTEVSIRQNTGAWKMDAAGRPNTPGMTFPSNVRPLNPPKEDTATPVFPNEDLPVYPPEEGPSMVRVSSRTPTSMTLVWDPPAGTLPTLYNLLMDRVSIYSGAARTYTQTGLTAEKCFVFQVAAYVDGRWTKFSKPKRTSSLTHSVSVEKVDEQIATLRAEMEKQAMAKTQANPCLLTHMSNMGAIHTGQGGGGGSIEYNAEVSDFSAPGIEASVLNCQVSKCLANNGLTTTLVKPRMGHLNVRQDDGAWKLRFVSIPENTNLLEYNNPGNAFVKVTINLMGCRANKLDAAAGALIGKVGVGAKKCLALNCTRDMKVYHFCEPSSGPPVQGRYSIDAWRHDINRATYPVHRFNRFEADVKVTIAPKLAPDELGGEEGEVDHRIYAATGYREPFFLSFLTRLVRIDATPHFPQLLGTFRCNNLPNKFADPPSQAREKEGGGILPPRTLTGSVASTVARMKVDGDTFSSNWAGMVVEPMTSDLQTFLDNFKGVALDNDWVRGIMFQLIHGLGVANHAYGFHHNDLLTMSNIRLKQYPREAKGVRKYACYQLNEHALSGDGCGGEGGMGEAASDHDAARKKEEHGGGGASFLETHVSEWSDPTALQNKPPTMEEKEMLQPSQQDKNQKAASEQCIAGVSDDALPSDLLPNSVCETGEFVDKAAPSTTAFLEANAGRQDAEDGGETKRLSWCVPYEDVDGMMVKIHIGGSTTLSKKAVEYWKRGYVFPNLPWNDDLYNVAVILCGYIAPHMSTLDIRARDLCRRMKDGHYQANPLSALRHPYFDDYLKKEQMPVMDRNNYVYTPEEGCECAAKNGKRGNTAAFPVHSRSNFTGRENPENGIPEMKISPPKVEKTTLVAGQRKNANVPFLGTGHTPVRSDLMLANRTKNATGVAAPMTPWIALMGGNGLDVSATVKWSPYPNSHYYNVMLDGISVYSGPETKFVLNNLRETRCYRVTVAAFINHHGWTPQSKALHMNECGLRSDARR
eukprot:Stramenopile-MAST_4_protein_2724